MKIEHVAIRVTDFDRAKKFYSKYLGFEQYDYMDEPPCGLELHLRSGDVEIELFSVVESSKEPDLGEIGKNDRGICHLCLSVDNPDAVYNKLKEDGVPITLDWTPVDLSSGRNGRCFFFKDPDDTIIEIIDWKKGI